MSTPQQPATSAPQGGGGRAVPYFCPFCSGEDLRPHPAQAGAWHCRSCMRLFTVGQLGMEDPR